MQNGVFLSVNEYNDLKAKSERTEEYIQELVDKRIHDKAIYLSVRLNSDYHNDEVIEVRTWDKLHPQIKDVVERVKRFVNYEIKDFKQELFNMQDTQKLITDYQNNVSFLIKTAVIGWVLAIAFLIGMIFCIVL